MILLSACLARMATRYDGQRLEADLPFDIAITPAIPVCPEQLGGLPTPRVPACIMGGTGHDVLDGKASVVRVDGVDVTENFIRGAKEISALAERLNIAKAIMCERSPSCGVYEIKDQDGSVRKGCGVAVAALQRIGVACIGISGRKVKDE